jgi:hypothetical protein
MSGGVCSELRHCDERLERTVCRIKRVSCGGDRDERVVVLVLHHLGPVAAYVLRLKDPQPRCAGTPQMLDGNPRPLDPQVVRDLD